MNSTASTREGKEGAAQYTYVWMVQDFREDQIDGVSKGKYRKKYTRQAMDCPSGRMAGASVELTDENDGGVARYDLPGYQWDWETPAPNTFGADFIQQICKLQADKNPATRDEKTK